MITKLLNLSECKGFEWDAGNYDKNWIAHKVSRSECEQIFFNHPLLVADDDKHSESEPRYFALGKTNTRRKLFVSFTVRNYLIRVISARDMTRNEKRRYSLL
jgi:uncharacterized DUF497 family protein